MKVRVRRWGNSLALRIPKPFAEDADVEEGTVVDLSVSDGKLVASPSRKPRVALRSLLAKITKTNIHEEIETGPAVGNEVW